MAGEQSGGWVVRFRDTGRYYVSDEVSSTGDLDRATTYLTQADAHGVVTHIKQTWSTAGPLDIVSLTGARVETLTGRDQPAPGVDPDAEALKQALGWDPRGEVPIDQKELPQELDHLLWAAFPPGNRSAGGFERGLVQLFTDADAWNFVRLAQGFPLHAVAMLLWDAGLVKERTGGTYHGSWLAHYKLVDDRALWTWLKRPDKTWRQKFDATRFILNSPRTSSQGRQVSLPEVDHGR
jgi:hypothetical protein